MRKKCSVFLAAILLAGRLLAQSPVLPTDQPLYQSPDAGTTTGWVSPENPTGAPGQGGRTNQGAKGNAFYILSPGEQKVIYDLQGAGMITRIWFSGSIAVNAEQRRAVRVDMYWDGATKPAVSAPIGDLFGIAHGLIAKMDNTLFASPEARSMLLTIPMPYRKGARITLTNESSSEVLFWYDINFLRMKTLPANAMYFHAYWHRELKTTLGKDFEVLPKVTGKGRYLGANIGVIGDSVYNGTWFGEGEVKAYLDGDQQYPSLAGTGTEDYIGSGWGQGEYANRNSGSPVANATHDVYAFYRYHIPDPVFFQQNCRVTLQQIGNTNAKRLQEMKAKGVDLLPVWFFGNDASKSYQGRLLEEHKTVNILDPKVDYNSCNFYRSDDVCATAYFYLDRPVNDLPPLAPVTQRLKYLKEKVWEKLK